METSDGDARKKRKGTPAQTARRRRKPTGAAAPPSLALPLSMRMGLGDGGAPTARRRRKPTGAAAPPSLAPPPSLRMVPSDGAATRKRTEPPVRRDSKKGRRADSVGNSGRDGSGGGGGGHATQGSPDGPAAPTALPKDVGAPGRISVARTPNIPPRFEGLLKNISSLIPSESKGKSYECTLNRMNTFLNWSKSEMALFFEWSDNEEKMTCWVHDILKRKHFKFTVNAAFSITMDNINVERAAVAFSTNFTGGDEYWSGLKDMLLNMFGSFEGEGLKEYDYLYVFTRVGDSVYFRNFKIISLPNVDDPSSGLVLTEINTMFCLKLINDQGTPSSSIIGSDLPKDQTPTKLILCPVTLYIISNGQTGSCSFHEVDFSGQTYSVLLDNGSYVPSLQKLEGFNISLAEIVVIEPLLKIKHIIGSATNKTHCFARERCKSILQSLFAEFAKLLESGKCVSETGQIFMHNVLIRGANVRLYGLELTDYTEVLAKRSVEQLVEMVRKCFPSGTIPEDLDEFLNDLEKNPLDEIRIAEDDCSLMKAQDRRMLLININTEYMTNVKAKSSESDDEIDEQINDVTFFDNCPYAKEWKQIMKDNKYMVQICKLEESSDENGSDEDEDTGNQKVDPSVVQRVKKKRKMSKNTSRIKKFAQKKKRADNKGKLQFRSKRNFVMIMPEKARKDGIIPFRLGMADYIFTAYFPRYLRFVQRSMREVKMQSGKFKKRKHPSYVVRGLGQ